MGISKEANNLWRADFYCKDLQGNRVRMRKGIVNDKRYRKINRFDLY